LVWGFSANSLGGAMKIKYRRANVFIVFPLILILSSFLNAALFCDLDFHGFNEAGDVLAFTVQEQQPESYPTISFYTVDVKSNSFIDKPMRFTVDTYEKDKRFSHLFKSDDEDYPNKALLKVHQQLIEPELRKYGILKNNFGDHAVSRQNAEIVPFPHQAVFVVGHYDFEQSCYSIGSPFPFSGKEARQVSPELYVSPSTDKNFRTCPYEIRLSTFQSGVGDFEEPLVAFKLTVENLVTGKIKVLQEDKVLPKSRCFIYGYAIKDVYVVNKSVAVFIAMRKKIFEGEGVDYIVVTGFLPDDY